MSTATRATIQDLMATDGKAELIGGSIKPLMPTGRKPNRIAGRIFRSLDEYATRQGIGEAYTDNMGFIVPELPSGRESFSPDASFYDGPFPDDDMRFIEGPPTFAVEVRSDNDYGPSAEAELATKRADYFAAGTKVIWDVDPVNRCIHVYRMDKPDQAETLTPGDTADAEPAVPGWRMGVSEILG